MIKISYAITAHNEAQELDRLLKQLTDNIDKEDEIVVQMDTKATADVKFVVDKYAIKSYVFGLNNDFAAFKNKLKSECKGDYIFFIDADEYLSENLLKLLKQVLESNSQVDCYGVPRVNTVTGLTEEHIKKWGWVVKDDKINWPDYQTRICKNVHHIKWISKVHERLEGWQVSSVFPADFEDWALHHPKTIERQEQQNNYYNTL
jgi:glycosyltransferase involved in cell wall biosynthesis